MHQVALRALEASRWSRKLRSFCVASTPRALFELAITIGPFVLLWAAMVFAVHVGQFWVYAILVVPAGGLLVRLFMIQHDCGHGAFFPTRRKNDWTGRVIGVLTLTPYGTWRYGHAIHHASCGNLDRRGIGDVDTLTVREFRAATRWAQLRYRLYRHPAVMFGVGPFYLFFLQNRLPFGFMRTGWSVWISTMTTNIAVLALAGFAIWAVGFVPFLLVHLPIMILGASVGVWLFYVQHQFEKTHWESGERWSLHEAALHGSSHYDLPLILRWFTANIGLHHIHHLASRIPYYRLPRALRENPELQSIGRINFLQSLRCVRLVLWDEERRQLVSFKDVGKAA